MAYPEWIPQKNSNLRKKLLCLHCFGPLWTISTGDQWEIRKVGCLSFFIDLFVWFHIVCDRYTSDYAHFTFSDTIWPLLLSPDFGTQMITLAETASYGTIGKCIINIDPYLENQGISNQRVLLCESYSSSISVWPLGNKFYSNVK